MAALASAMIAGSANAATVLYNSNVISDTSTNWANVLNFTKLDPSLGTLTSIKVTLNGSLGGTARAESEDDSATTVQLNLGATIMLTRPDNSVIVVSSPLLGNTFNASSSDNVFDFGGTSGITYWNLTASLVNNVTLDSLSDLALFT